MGSEGDARDEDTDQSRSEFGPPLDDFGPPVSEFGPPVGEFGPPTGGQAPQWSVPESATDHPELAWRPADEPATMPPPPPQYRAPDSTSYADAPPPPPRSSPPRQQPADPGGEATVRHSTAPATGRETWWSGPGEPGPRASSPRESDSRELSRVPKPAPQPAGLSWVDDPIAQRLTPEMLTAATSPARNGSRGRWIALGVIAAVLVVIALVVTFVAVSRGDKSDSAPAAPPPTTTAALSCPASKDGKVTRGNGSGDTATGPAAILGFQYAFYVDRNGERARRFVDPEAENVSTADIIQQAINDQIPVGTTHCLRIAEVGADTFEVDLTEHRPDGTTTVYRQTVTTANRDGKILIHSIKERI